MFDLLAKWDAKLLSPFDYALFMGINCCVLVMILTRMTQVTPICHAYGVTYAHHLITVQCRSKLLLSTLPLFHWAFPAIFTRAGNGI